MPAYLTNRIPLGDVLVAQVEILSEDEVQGGWEFFAQVLDDDGTLSQHRVTLRWADYNLWSADGSDQPAKVVEAVLDFLLSRITPNQLQAKFDASTVRRRFPDADDAIPTFIR
jgi:hypothetical protein